MATPARLPSPHPVQLPAPFAPRIVHDRLHVLIGHTCGESEFAIENGTGRRFPAILSTERARIGTKRRIFMHFGTN